MILLFFFLIIFLIIVWDKYGFKDQRLIKCSKNFNGPAALPIIGNSLPYMRTVPGELLWLVQSFFNNYGNNVRVWIFKRLIIITKDPKLFEALLSNQKQLSKNNAYQDLYDWLGNGLLVSTGQKWFTRRKIITPTFHFKILQQFVDVFNQQNRVFIKTLKKSKCEEPFDIYNMITLMSLDIICQTAMGVELNSQVTDCDYARRVREISYIISNRIKSVWKRSNLLFSFTKEKKSYDECLKKLHAFTRNIIEKRRQTIVNEDIDIQNMDDESVGMKKKLAFLDVLLKSTVNGQPLSNDDIAEEVDTFMFEGHDTTTSALTFTFYLLSQHPEIQQKVYEEVTRIVGSDLSVDPTYNQLLDMKYLESCIKESLRLYPSVPMIGRTLDEDLNFDGKIIPATTNINLSIFHMNRDPKYFTDAEEFRPERFFEKVSLNENAFIYVPFSAGPRNCIGQKFAMLELKSSICNVVRNFELLKSDVKLKIVTHLILKSSNGIYVGFRSR